MEHRPRAVEHRLRAVERRPKAVEHRLRAVELYTSDAADDTPCVDHGGRSIV